MANGKHHPPLQGSANIAELDIYNGITLLHGTTLHNRLYAWCQHNEVLPEQQFGFIKGKSTHKAIETLNSETWNSVTDNGKLYAVFVDFRRPFDTIDRTMLPKLVKTGVTRGFICVLDVILKCNVLRSVNGSYLSQKITQKSGVPQGDKLSPLLFFLFIADLPKVFENFGCRCILYADDLVLTSDKLFDVQLALYMIGIFCRWTSGKQGLLNLEKAVVWSVQINKLPRGPSWIRQFILLPRS